ncbi:unnamed protein product [Mytilus edulis]|uniref:C2H2-type domain-containing protein n=1 Tax=Mytilus edulis TaxID=6550 RepID=A0A8S3QT19_MYTED|nr:unnamed protein product [Mytilus edulis]
MLPFSVDKPEHPKIIFENDDAEESNMTQVHSEMTQFSHITSYHDGKHEVVLSDPVFCNPNSIATVARVLKKIGEENGIIKYGGTKRHWTFVCCDGLPYMIIKKLKEEAVVCAIEGCGKSFLSMDNYSNHTTEIHPTVQRRFVFEFDWLYVRIGSGHYEMNLIKGFFALNWIPVLENLCQTMGFESDSAKNFAKSCKDHHKSWRLLLIFHLGTLQELVLPYVRHSMLTNKKPDAKGFLKYSSENYTSSSYPNFTYMVDQVCKYSQGIINFRMANRRNNADLLKSAKYMTKEIFHGRNHPKYQMIELYDSIQDRMMPDDVRSLSDKYSSITTSGNPSLGEDFRLHSRRKKQTTEVLDPKRCAF